jgi:hypothetical protein
MVIRVGWFQCAPSVECAHRQLTQPGIAPLDWSYRLAISRVIVGRVLRAAVRLALPRAGPECALGDVSATWSPRDSGRFGTLRSTSFWQFTTTPGTSWPRGRRFESVFGTVAPCRTGSPRFSRGSQQNSFNFRQMTRRKRVSAWPISCWVRGTRAAAPQSFNSTDRFWRNDSSSS